MVELVTCGSAADGRRRTDVLRSCHRLDDLHEQLKNLGYLLSATYLRPIPRRFNTEEGKRQVNTVPVKLIEAQTSEHKSHSDTAFCHASFEALHSLVSLLGPSQVFYCSQDDKATLPIDITKAHKQSSI